jgi:hypothetical protein
VRWERYTVTKFDEVVRHPHLVTQDQFSLVWLKDSGIPEDNFIINSELFRQTFTNVELLQQKPNISKLTPPGREPTPSDLHSNALPLLHIFFFCVSPPPGKHIKAAWEATFTSRFRYEILIHMKTLIK